jgi:hypothetical protein
LPKEDETSQIPEDSTRLAEDHKEGKAPRGVLRLLQEGHFKGVADLRLRINFFDQLAAIGQGESGEESTDAPDDPPAQWEPSAPNGNGVAYEKFLAIYNKIQTTRASADNAQEATQLDTSA